MIEAPAQVWDWMAASTKAPLDGTPSENSLQG
jgi:hypothetical protein